MTDYYIFGELMDRNEEFDSYEARVIGIGRFVMRETMSDGTWGVRWKPDIEDLDTNHYETLAQGKPVDLNVLIRKAEHEIRMRSARHQYMMRMAAFLEIKDER